MGSVIIVMNNPSVHVIYCGYDSYTGCEGTALVLHCESMTTIRIQDAFYGRDDRVTCPHHNPSAMEDTGCSAGKHMRESTVKHGGGRGWWGWKDCRTSNQYG